MNLWEALNAQPVAGTHQDKVGRWNHTFLDDNGKMTVYSLSPRDGLTVVQAACILATDSSFGTVLVSSEDQQLFFSILEKAQLGFAAKYKSQQGVAAQTITDHVVGL